MHYMTQLRQHPPRMIRNAAVFMPSAYRSPAVARLMELQRSAGNRAVSSLLSQSHLTIQRVGPPTTASGLAVESTLGEYAGEVEKCLESLSEHGDDIPAGAARKWLEVLMDYINKGFHSSPVKAVKVAFGGRRWGEFHPGKWTMRIGLKPRDRLTRAEFKEFAVTIYHESRHAEQDFLEARVFAYDNPELSADELRAKYKLQLHSDALNLAWKIGSEGIAPSGAHRQLVGWLQESPATVEEVMDYLRSVSGNASEEFLLNQLDTLNFRSWKTVVVNTAFDKAKKSAGKLRGHIESYNSSPPRNLALVDATVNDNHHQELLRHWNTYQSKGIDQTAFLRAYREYLEIRRQQALEGLRAAFLAYSVAHPTENDAHSVEALLRSKLEFPPGLERSEIPNPRVWQPPPLPPREE